MYCVYWQDWMVLFNKSKCKMFDDLTPALKFANQMRSMGHKFVVLASEVPSNVTKMGVDTVDENYDWKKRRI